MAHLKTIIVFLFLAQACLGAVLPEAEVTTGVPQAAATTEVSETETSTAAKGPEYSEREKLVIMLTAMKNGLQKKDLTDEEKLGIRMVVTFSAINIALLKDESSEEDTSTAATATVVSAQS